MPYDERYTPYIQQAGLLPWIQLVSRSTPNLNAPLVSSLADRWRPETHTFHLPCGEMTITLQDLKFILCLKLGGIPVTGVLDGDDWQTAVENFCGVRPPDETSK